MQDYFLKDLKSLFFYIYVCVCISEGFPGGSDCKESTCNAEKVYSLCVQWVFTKVHSIQKFKQKSLG